MINRLILFLVRKKLHVRKYEYFQFINQKTNNIYYFTDKILVKLKPENKNYKGLALMIRNRVYSMSDSNVSLNWLLSEDCEIRIFEDA